MVWPLDKIRQGAKVETTLELDSENGALSQLKLQQKETWKQQVPPNNFSGATNLQIIL